MQCIVRRPFWIQLDLQHWGGKKPLNARWWSHTISLARWQKGRTLFKRLGRAVFRPLAFHCWGFSAVCSTFLRVGLLQGTWSEHNVADKKEMHFGFLCFFFSLYVSDITDSAMFDFGFTVSQIPCKWGTQRSKAKTTKPKQNKSTMGMISSDVSSD